MKKRAKKIVIALLLAIFLFGIQIVGLGVLVHWDQSDPDERVIVKQIYCDGLDAFYDQSGCFPDSITQLDSTFISERELPRGYQYTDIRYIVDSTKQKFELQIRANSLDYFILNSKERKWEYSETGI